VLELRELVKHYVAGDGSVVRAVDGVSLSVGSGELLALYGPSGSGKTTLLEMCAGVLEPDRGEVHVAGREISGLSGRDVARYRMSELGFIRQSLELIPGASALDNAAVKLMGKPMSPRKARRAVRPLLEGLGLGGRLTQRADRLSMGERQRVMIARALSNEPKLVLADEPTGSLDSERGGEVLEMLSELCRDRGMAVLLVTHDPEAAAYADRVQTLRDGGLIEGWSGTGLAAGSGQRGDLPNGT
jgi:putative ABC transport system ATP-binding protein